MCTGVYFPLQNSRQTVSVKYIHTHTYMSSNFVIVSNAKLCSMLFVHVQVHTCVKLTMIIQCCICSCVGQQYIIEMESWSMQLTVSVKGTRQLMCVKLQCQCLVQLWWQTRSQKLWAVIRAMCVLARYLSTKVTTRFLNYNRA